MKSYPFTAYEKRVLRACGISANDLVFNGFNSVGAEYTLVNRWFYVYGCYSGYTKQQIYRDMARKFIARAEKACSY